MVTRILVAGFFVVASLLIAVIVAELVSPTRRCEVCNKVLRPGKEVSFDGGQSKMLEFYCKSCDTVYTFPQ